MTMIVSQRTLAVVVLAVVVLGAAIALADGAGHVRPALSNSV